MLHFAPLLWFRRRAARLLTLGLLAVALQALAGAGLPRLDKTAGDGFEVELCTSHGVVRRHPAQGRDGGSQPDTRAHDCCKLCAATGPLLAGNNDDGVMPAPACGTPADSHACAAPTLEVRTAHFPRGPPANA